MGVPAAKADLSRLYRDTRNRLTALVSELDDAALAARVPACPAWSVRDVVAHLAAVAEDVLAGRLTGPPGEDETAAQVARFADRAVPEIIATWAASGPQFEQFVGDLRVWPAVIDVASHEQDIRGAVRRPGARDADVIWHCAGRLLTWLKTPVPLRVAVEDAEFLSGADNAARLTLTTTRFEAFRWRMGRRSRAQLAALRWSADPAPVLDCLTVFGPSAGEIVE